MPLAEHMVALAPAVAFDRQVLHHNIITASNDSPVIDGVCVNACCVRRVRTAWQCGSV